MLSAPAQAGTVGSGDNLAVRLSGFMWFQAHVLDQDVSAGSGRGYDFDIPETELHVNATNTADNGLKYGVSIEMEVNTDATNNGDEAWAFISGDFGRIEMGDQDDATNRMLVGAHQAHQGICGPFGGLGCLAPVFQGTSEPWQIARTDWQVATSNDRTKITYFSPRFAGFQVGVSHTPDGSNTANGASFGETDNNSGFEKMWGLGLNYTGKFDDFGLSASVLYETAEQEVGGADNVNEDIEVFYVGAKVDFSGFTVGANYRDNGDSNLTKTATDAGADSGSFWAAGIGYKQGPWGVSAWYSLGEQEPETSAVTEEMTRYGVGARYAVAPGWQLRADLSFLEHENRGGEVSAEDNRDQDSTAFILTNMFNF